MRNNNVVFGYPKSTGILRVDGLSTGPLGFGASHDNKKSERYTYKSKTHEASTKHTYTTKGPYHILEKVNRVARKERPQHARGSKG